MKKSIALTSKDTSAGRVVEQEYVERAVPERVAPFDVYIASAENLKGMA
jgi:hypothetical protein